MIKYFANRRVLLSAILIGASYWGLVAIIPSTTLLEIMDGLLLPLSVLVIIIFYPLAIKELKKNELDRTGRLLVGIALGWTATLFLRSLAVYGRSFGRVTPFIESPFFGFIVWCLIWSAFLHITAPHADMPFSTSPYGKWIIVALLAGGLVAGFFLGVQAGHWFDESMVIKPMTG